MSKFAGLLVICAVILVTHMIVLAFPAVEASSSGGDHGLGWLSTTTSTVGSRCRGSMAECLAEGADLEIDDMMDSETNRRILATNNRYISYGSLSKNNVPCSRRGASYYNCRSGGQANPYTRGCSAITRCRRWAVAFVYSYYFICLKRIRFYVNYFKFILDWSKSYTLLHSNQISMMMLIISECNFDFQLYVFIKF